ncbi:MAG: DinB family protein [Thermoanaerobaculia bacterium]
MSEAFATGEPFSGEEISAAMVRLHAVSERYLAAVPAEEFVQAQGEKWSPADHVRHLTKSTRPLVPALGLPKLLLGLRFGRASRESRRFSVLRGDYRRLLLLPGAGAGRFAPSARPLPADLDVWQREVLSSWRCAVSGLALKIPGWTESALDRYLLPHPLLGKLTVREMLFFTIYHNAHHLDQVAARR